MGSLAPWLIVAALAPSTQSFLVPLVTLCYALKRVDYQKSLSCDSLSRGRKSKSVEVGGRDLIGSKRHVPGLPTQSWPVIKITFSLGLVTSWDRTSAFQKSYRETGRTLQLPTTRRTREGSDRAGNSTLNCDDGSIPYEVK